MILVNFTISSVILFHIVAMHNYDIHNAYICILLTNLSMYLKSLIAKDLVQNIKIHFLFLLIDCLYAFVQKMLYSFYLIIFSGYFVIVITDNIMKRSKIITPLIEVIYIYGYLAIGIARLIMISSNQ